MNSETKETLTITISGNLTIARDDLEQLMRRLVTSNLPPIGPALVPKVNLPEGDGKKPRLAYSVRETAELLGVSPITVYRLIYRGLLKPSGALRHKLIAKSEIERFLQDTSQSD